MRGYPLDHRLGYSLVPRDLGSLEPVMRSAAARGVYLLLVCRVRHVPGWARGSHGDVWLERGQAIYGVREVASDLGHDKNTITRALRLLERVGLISRSSGKRGSVVTLLNYGEYGGGLTGHADSHADSLADSHSDSIADTLADTLAPLTNGRTGNGKRKSTCPQKPLGAAHPRSLPSGSDQIYPPARESADITSTYGAFGEDNSSLISKEHEQNQEPSSLREPSSFARDSAPPPLPPSHGDEAGAAGLNGHGVRTDGGLEGLDGWVAELAVSEASDAPSTYRGAERSPAQQYAGEGNSACGAGGETHAHASLTPARADFDSAPASPPPGRGQLALGPAQAPQAPGGHEAQRAPRARRSSRQRQRKPRAQKQASDEAYGLADYLRAQLLAHKPDHAIGSGRHDERSWPDSLRRREWALELDRMHRLEHRDWDRSAELVEWACGDQGRSDRKFRMIVESAQSLRAKWDRLDERAGGSLRASGLAYAVGERNEHGRRQL